jgi:hypothetical protein
VIDFSFKIFYQDIVIVPVVEISYGYEEKGSVGSRLLSPF